MGIDLQTSDNVLDDKELDATFKDATDSLRVASKQGKDKDGHLKRCIALTMPTHANDSDSDGNLLESIWGGDSGQKKPRKHKGESDAESDPGTPIPRPCRSPNQGPPSQGQEPPTPKLSPKPKPLPPGPKLVTPADIRPKRKKDRCHTYRLAGRRSAGRKKG